MKQFPTDSAERRVMALASRTVFAVANTRIRGDVEEADAMIGHYLEDAQREGVSLAMAWALCTSAAINEFTTAITLLAVEHDVSAETALSEAAMAFAQESLT